MPSSNDVLGRRASGQAKQLHGEHFLLRTCVPTDHYFRQSLSYILSPSKAVVDSLALNTPVLRAPALRPAHMGTQVLSLSLLRTEWRRPRSAWPLS